MSIWWDDAKDGSIYDHNGDLIATLDPDKTLTYPDDVQKELSAVWEEEANLGNSPVMSAYAGELLLRKVDGDIKRTTVDGSLPDGY